MRTANEITEALAGIRIPGEARQCLDVVFRKTYGFNKKKDKIPLSQFCLLTKMSRPSVCRALLKLKQMNIIIIEKDNEGITIYVVNKDFSTWKSLTKKITINKKVNDHLQKSKKSLTKKRHSKDNTKDTLKIQGRKKVSDEENNYRNLKLKEMNNALMNHLDIKDWIENKELQKNYLVNIKSVLLKIGEEKFMNRLVYISRSENKYVVSKRNSLKYIFEQLKAFNLKAWKQ